MNNYTTTPIREDTLVEATPTATPDDRARLLGFANYFGARISRKPPGYIMTPVRAHKFERLFRAGFCADGKVLRHPAVSRKYTTKGALNILALADYLVDQRKQTEHTLAP